jgi:hypothetical protein
MSYGIVHYDMTDRMRPAIGYYHDGCQPKHLPSISETRIWGGGIGERKCDRCGMLIGSPPPGPKGGERKRGAA